MKDVADNAVVGIAQALADAKLIMEAYPDCRLPAETLAALEQCVVEAERYKHTLQCWDRLAQDPRDALFDSGPIDAEVAA